MTETRRPGCLDANMMAEYIDGGLEPRQRAEVEAHLAECGECYETFSDAVRQTDSNTGLSGLGHVIPNGESGRSRAAKWWWIAAAAAVIAFGGLRPDGFWRARPLDRAVADLVTAVGQSRFTEGRMAEPFAYGPAPAPNRGAVDARTLPRSVREAALNIEKLTERAGSLQARRAWALARLVQGQTNEAISVLESIAEEFPMDTLTRIELSAALLERSRQSGIVFDATKALDSATIALSVSPNQPAALFNRALALEAIGDKSGAIAAWNRYLSVDPSSPWASEALAHLDALKRELLPLSTNSDFHAAPRTVEAFLESQIENWSSATTEGRDFDTALVRSRVAAFDGKWADRQVADMFALVQKATYWPFERRGCLARGIQSFRQAKSRFDQVSYEAAAAAVGESRKAFACAGVQDIEVKLLSLQIDWFSTHRVEDLALLEKLEVVAAAAEHWRTAGRIHYVLGLGAFRASRISQALDHYDRSRDAYRRADDLSGQGAASVLAAEARDQQGDSLASWTDYKRALSALPAMVAYRSRHTALVSIAIACQKQGLFGCEEYFADRLQDYATSEGSSIGLMAAHLHRANALSHLSGADAARPELTAAHAAHERIEDPTFRRQYAADLAWMEGRILQSADPNAAIKSLTAAIAEWQQSGFRTRLSETLLVRGRALAAVGRIGEARSDWNQAAKLFEDQQLGIREEQLRISRASDLWDVFAEMIASVDTPAEKLEWIERSKARALLDSLGSSSKTSAAIRDLSIDWLPPNTVVVVFASLPDRLLRLTIRRGTISADSRPIGAASVAETTRRLFATEPTGDWQSNPLLLGLLPDGVCRNPDDLLVIVPDGGLYRVPFSALRTEHDNEPLIRRCVPIVVPSIAVYRRIAAQAPTKSPRGARVLLVQADRGWAIAGLPELSSAREEIHDIDQIYSGGKLLQGPRLTLKAFLEGAAHADIIHIAGHAIADDLFPSRSRLLLDPGSPEPWLDINHILSIKIERGALVVLGACETAAGRVFRGEGSVSLARAFLQAGASHVIAAKWQVNDRATRALLVQMHRQIALGDPPSRALARAQRAVANDGMPAAQWSAFEVVGG